MSAIWLAVLAGLCWGIGEVCTKSVLQTHRIGPLSAIALRSTIALPVIWGAWWLIVHRLGIERPPELSAMERGDTLKLVLGSGISAGALGMICFYAALNLDEISRIKPIAFTIAPAVAVLLGWLLLREPISLQRASAVLLILSGVILLTR